MSSKSVLLASKEKINNVTWIRDIFRKFPHIMHRLDPVIPMSLTIKLFYYIRMGKKLNLKEPKDLNEKLQWLKIYYRDPLYVQCADKYRVRDYVARQGFEEILNSLYRVYENAEDINFDGLPDRFALKCNHASATNVICDDKSSLDEVEIKRKFRRWLKRKNGYIAGEYHYNYIKPLILAERNLASKDGVLPIDYKIFCFNGKPYYIAIYVDRDRETLSTKRAFFDFHWNHQDFVLPQHFTNPERFKKPETLDQMYYIAECLSAPFPFVRVDLYEIDGKVLFGELTFFPTGGFGRAYTEECLKRFGDLITLPQKSKTRKWV